MARLETVITHKLGYTSRLWLSLTFQTCQQPLIILSLIRSVWATQPPWLPTEIYASALRPLSKTRALASQFLFTLHSYTNLFSITEQTLFTRKLNQTIPIFPFFDLINFRLCTNSSRFALQHWVLMLWFDAGMYPIQRRKYSLKTLTE